MKSTIEKLFIDEFGFNINDMAFNMPYNVEEANIAILAFDEENNSDAYAKVISAIKKPCKNSVVIKLENKEDWEEPVDAKHLYAIYKSNNKVDYCYAEDLVKGNSVLTSSGLIKIVDTKKDNTINFTLDIQTSTGNYYTNNILSHNSPMAKLPTPTGGTAIKFFSSTRNRISKLDTLKNGDDAIGIQIRVRNYKNKTGIPNRDAIMNLYFDGGFNSDDEYFDFLVMFGLIHKAGGWFDAADIGMPKLQGSAKVKDWLKQNPDIYEDLKKKVDSMLMSKNVLDENNIDYEKAEQNGVTVEETKTPAQLAMEALGLQENPPDLGL